MRKLVGNSLLVVICSLFATSTFGGEPIVYSPDGKLVAIGKRNGSIELIEVETGKVRKVVSQLDSPPHPASSVVWRPNLAFSPDGVVLASACGSSEVTLWNTDSGDEIMALPSSAVGYDLTFSSDGLFLVGVGADTKIGPERLTLWNADTGEIVKELTVETEGFAGASQNIKAVQFADSGSILAFETFEDGQPTVNVWDTSTGKETMKIAASSWTLSSNGKHLAIRQADNDRHFVWDAESGKVIRELGAMNQ